MVRLRQLSNDSEKVIVLVQYSWSHLSEHAGTKECSDNWNVWISTTVLFVYEAEHFPFNAQQNIYEYYYFGVRLSKYYDNWSSNKWLLTISYFTIWYILQQPSTVTSILNKIGALATHTH